MTARTYSTPGSFSWLCPPGVTTVESDCTGAAAGGIVAGAGGGGGGYGQRTALAVTPGQSYPGTVGRGGAAGTPGSGSARVATYLSHDSAHGVWVSDDAVVGPGDTVRTFNNTDIGTFDADGSPNRVRVIVSYKTQQTVAQIQAYLAGAPAGRKVTVIYHHEPEGDYPSGGATFVAEFKQQSANIRQAAANLGMSAGWPNGQVSVAMCAAGAPYNNSGSADVLAGNYVRGLGPYVDLFTKDIYQHAGDWSSNGLANLPRWTNWASVVLDASIVGTVKPAGVTEYGIDTSTTITNAQRNTRLSLDGNYLGGAWATRTGRPTPLWNYWYTNTSGNSYRFTDSATLTTWSDFLAGGSSAAADPVAGSDSTFSGDITSVRGGGGLTGSGATGGLGGDFAGSVGFAGGNATNGVGFRGGDASSAAGVGTGALGGLFSSGAGNDGNPPGGGGSGSGTTADAAGAGADGSVVLTWTAATSQAIGPDPDNARLTDAQQVPRGQESSPDTDRGQEGAIAVIGVADLVSAGRRTRSSGDSGGADPVTGEAGFFAPGLGAHADSDTGSFSSAPPPYAGALRVGSGGPGADTGAGTEAWSVNTGGTLARSDSDTGSLSDGKGSAVLYHPFSSDSRPAVAEQQSVRATLTRADTGGADPAAGETGFAYGQFLFAGDDEDLSTGTFLDGKPPADHYADSAGVDPVSGESASHVTGGGGTVAKSSADHSAGSAQDGSVAVSSARIAHWVGLDLGRGGFPAGNAAVGPSDTHRLFCQTLPASFDADGTPASVLIVYSYKSTTQTVAQIQAFLAGMEAQRRCVLIYHHEPEGDYPDGAQFVTEFKAESVKIRSAIANLGYSTGYPDGKVMVVMCSSGAPYATGYNGTDKASILAGDYLLGLGPYVDFFTKDIYQHASGWPSNGLANYSAWTNWAVRVSDAAIVGTRKPVGITEYGIDTSTTITDAQRNARLDLDAQYLSSAFPALTGFPMPLWCYWYENTSPFTYAFTDAPTVALWESIELGTY